jgi:hypothetical protein
LCRGNNFMFPEIFFKYTIIVNLNTSREGERTYVQNIAVLLRAALLQNKIALEIRQHETHTHEPASVGQGGV